jgi:anthranilate synthase component II
MGIRIKNSLTYGLQFHPESILTPSGELIISNFIELIKAFGNEQSVGKAI